MRIGAKWTTFPNNCYQKRRAPEAETFLLMRIQTRYLSLTGFSPRTESKLILFSQLLPIENRGFTTLHFISFGYEKEVRFSLFYYSSCCFHHGTSSVAFINLSISIHFCGHYLLPGERVQRIWIVSHKNLPDASPPPLPLFSLKAL